MRGYFFYVDCHYKILKNAEIMSGRDMRLFSKYLRALAKQSVIVISSIIVTLILLTMWTLVLTKVITLFTEHIYI